MATLQNLYLDPTTGDLVLNSSGQLKITSNFEEYILQKTRTSLSLFQGEHFLFPIFGIPYFQHILKKRPDFGLVRAVILKELTSIQGVDKILSLDLVQNNQTSMLDIKFNLTTTQDTTISGGVSI